MPLGIPRVVTGSTPARSAVVGLAAGVGVGMGYMECKYKFDAIAKAEKDTTYPDRVG